MNWMQRKWVKHFIKRVEREIKLLKNAKEDKKLLEYRKRVIIALTEIEEYFDISDEKGNALSYLDYNKMDNDELVDVFEEAIKELKDNI